MEGSVALLLHRLGGRATWRQLLQHTTSHQVRQAVGRGEIARAATDVYVLPALQADRVAAAAARGALCLECAARTHGLRTLRPAGETQVMVPNGRHPPVVAGVSYRYAALTQDELRSGRTSLLRTVLDCAAHLPFADALTVADSALNTGRLSEAQLITAAERLRGRGRARRLRVVRAADRGADSALESALRALLIEGGITGFRTQVLVPVGRFGIHVDLGDPDRRIAIEADGFAYHGGDQLAYDRGIKRHDEIIRLGWTLLRFNWAQVMFRPEWVLGVVRHVLAQAA